MTYQRNHQTHGRATGNAAHGAVFKVGGCVIADAVANLFGLLIQGPRQSVRRNLAHETGPPTRVKARNALGGGQSANGGQQIRVVAHHDVVGDHHLRRRHDAAGHGGNAARQKVQAGTPTLFALGQVGRALDEGAQLFAHHLQDGEIDGPVRDAQQEIGAGADPQARPLLGTQEFQTVAKAAAVLQNGLHGVGRVHGGLRDGPRNGTADHALPKGEGACHGDGFDGCGRASAMVLVVVAASLFGVCYSCSSWSFARGNLDHVSHRQGGVTRWSP